MLSYVKVDKGIGIPHTHDFMRVDGQCQELELNDFSYITTSYEGDLRKELVLSNVAWGHG